MADYMPVNTDNVFSSTASATISAGQLLKVSGTGTVAPVSATTDRAIGVAGKDCVSGERVTVYGMPGYVHESVNNNAGTITAGAAIVPGASGGVDTGTLATVAAAGTLIGIALTTATTTNKVRWIGV